MAPIIGEKEKKGPITLIEEVNAAFEAIKKVCAQDAILHYLDFNEEFDIHTNSSNCSIGEIISQKGRPVVYYSKKLIETQQIYLKIDQELLAIVEYLKQYKTIIIGQRIVVWIEYHYI